MLTSFSNVENTNRLSQKSCPHQNKSGSKPIRAPWAVRKVKKQIRRDMINIDPCNKMSAKTPKRLFEKKWHNLEIIGCRWPPTSSCHQLLGICHYQKKYRLLTTDFPQRFHSGSKTMNPLIFNQPSSWRILQDFTDKGGATQAANPLGDLLALLLSKLGSRDVFHDAWWLCKSQGLMENSNEKHRRKLQICEFHLPLNCWIGIYDSFLNGS